MPQHSHQVSIANTTSITAPNTKDSIQANVTMQSFTQIEKRIVPNTFGSIQVVPNTFHTIQGSISDPTIQEYIQKHSSESTNKEQLKFLDHSNVLKIPIYEYINKLHEALKQYEEQNDTKKIKAQINTDIAQITKSIEDFLKHYENVFNNDTLNTLEIRTTKDFFAQAREQAKAMKDQISQATAKAHELKKNYTHKTIAELIGHTLYFSHSGIVLHFANQYLSRGMVIWILKACLRINPYFAIFALLVSVIAALYKLISSNDEDTKIKIYELYCVLNSLITQIRTQNGAIGMLVDIDKSVSGNAMFINNKSLRYLTASLPYSLNALTPNEHNLIDEAICYNVYAEKNLPSNIPSLFTENNLPVDSVSNSSDRVFTFSTFPSVTKNSLQDKDIINTSAFKHLKHIMLQFSSFLCIQSPHFTSTLVLDMLLQSFKTSPQSNQPIHDKIMLFITNPLEIDSLHYKIHEYIQTQSRDSLQDNVVFLNTLSRIEKEPLFQRFKNQILTNYQNLETLYNDKYWIQEIFHRDKAEQIGELLDKFDYKNKDILSIANSFSEIADCILQQKHLFDEEFHQKIDKAKQHSEVILETLLVFEKIFSCFIDFTIQRDKNQKNDKDTLSMLKGKVRDTLKQNEPKLSITAFCITHIINNAYFSNSPSNEIVYIKELLKESNSNSGNSSYQRYKQIIEQYEVFPKDQRFVNAISAFMPLHKDILQEFFNTDEFEELCKFICYLVDLESKGVFLFYTYISASLSQSDIKISKQDLQKIILRDFSEKFQKFQEDKAIEHIVSYIKNNLAAFLAEIVLQEGKEKLKIFSQDSSYQSKDMHTIITTHIMTNTNISTLNKLIQAIEQQQTEEMIQKFQEAQKIQEAQLTIKLENIHNTTNARHTPFHNVNNANIPNVAFAIAKRFKGKLNPIIVVGLYDMLLDVIFPTISQADLKRQITLFMLGMRAKKDREYAKWEREKPYFYIPKDLHKTLIIGDFKHSLLLDTALDVGYCTTNPSIGAYTKNDDLAQTQCKDMIKNNLYPYNPYYFAHRQDSEATQIYKEAYTRVHAYIDNIPHNTSNAKHKKETLPSFTHLINKQLIQTKLQYQKIQDNKKYQSIGETTYTQKDFVIQLKRVAEYSYRVYKGERVLSKNPRTMNTRDSNEESILSNLIYNPSFIPTKIDIHKEL